jgi:hypothetical protein
LSRWCRVSSERGRSTWDRYQSRVGDLASAEASSFKTHADRRRRNTGFATDASVNIGVRQGQQMTNMLPARCANHRDAPDADRRLCDFVGAPSAASAR